MYQGKLLLILAVPAAALALVAAAPPEALTQVSGGMWEVRGIPNTQPLHQCFADPLVLAQIEHRTHNCTRTVISGNESQAVIEYKCSGGGFGRSKLTMVTPRSLSIETQGISDSFPFGYKVVAHRLGDCGPAPASPPATPPAH
jgi:hypothetical protein